MTSRNLLGNESDNNVYTVSYTSQSPAPVNYHMGQGILGSYDGLRLQPPDSTWRRYPSQNGLLNNPLFVPQHSGMPLANETVPVNVPRDSAFVFSHNVSSPFCCPSTYSSDMGCVCTTKQQRDFIGLTRGGNANYKYLGNPQF